MARKVSDRAKILLILIADHCKVTRDGDYLFWAPSANRNGDWSDSLETFVCVCGAGDANAIRGLYSRGLCDPVFATKSMPIPYASRVTDSGRALVAKLREAGEFARLAKIA